MYALPKKDQPTYQRKKDILTFYADDLISASVGHSQWPLKDRKFHSMVDTREIGGKQRPRVSSKGEAMTRVIYTNCHERWVLVVPEMAQNKDWKITPYSKHDEETHRWWKTKWSDMHSGKVEGAGWKPGAFTAFNSHLREIIALRELDSKRGWKLYKYCKKLVREKHGVKEKVATNKRKRKGQAPTESKLGPWWTSYRAPLSKVNNV